MMHRSRTSIGAKLASGEAATDPAQQLLGGSVLLGSAPKPASSIGHRMGEPIFTLFRLAMIAEMRDLDTSVHMLRVGQVAGLLAWKYTRDRNFADLVCRAAPFHDIGKICIADAVLKKPGPLDADEWAHMRQHAAIGARLLHCPQNALLRVAEEIALGHHERFDGSGYPNGLSGTAIALSARIAAVADYYDALAMNRCYRPAVAVEQILASLRELSGKNFDPQLVELFIASHDEFSALCRRINGLFAERPLVELDESIFAPVFWDAV